MLMNGYGTKPGRAAQTPLIDRRQSVRHDGAGLTAETGGETWSVVDVSTGGLAVRGLERQVGTRFRLVLSRVGAGPGVACECEVVGCDRGLTRLAFTSPTLPLLRLVVAHVSALTGIAPHLLKSS